jgi:hypothetical protein
LCGAAITFGKTRFSITSIDGAEDFDGALPLKGNYTAIGVADGEP